MYYVDFLAGVHARLRPPTYLEIGIRDGKSLALSRARSIGIDPAFVVRRELRCDVSLHRTTSDEYFAGPHACAHFGGVPPALSFIDGMHLFEFALRDFINVERRSAWHSVVVFDDVMPRYVDEAARERRTVNWTGDVYKVWLALAERRPDLVLLPVHTRPTGLLLVLNLDPANEVLSVALPETLAHYGLDDRPVPEAVLARTGAVDPQALLDSGLFTLLGDARERDEAADSGRASLRAFLDQRLDDMRVDWSTAVLPRPGVRAWAPQGKVSTGAAALPGRVRRRVAGLVGR
jgi:hypothetical protein